MAGALLISREQSVVVIETGPVYETTDSASVLEARDQILEEARLADPPIVLVDLGRTRYFGSPFVGLLFETWLKLRDRHGRLAFCNSQADVRRVLSTVRLEKVCPIFATREEALAALTSAT